VVVTTRYVDPYYAWDVNGRLYLPEQWCQDIERRCWAGIPDEVTFQTKPAIALGRIDEAREAGVPSTSSSVMPAMGTIRPFWTGWMPGTGCPVSSLWPATLGSACPKK